MTRAIVVKRDGAPVVLAAGSALLSSLTGQAKRSRDQAQSAASAALAAAGVGEYASTALGLAGTSIGETFWVDLGTGLGQVYRHDPGPVATALQSFILEPDQPAAASVFAGGVPTTTALASATGGIVGFKQDGTGAILRDLLAKAKETLSTTDMHAAIDGATDDSDALIATFAQMAVTGRANLLSGTYKVTKPLIVPPGILEGGNVVLDFRDANPADFPDGICVYILGGAKTQIANLSGDLGIGARAFPFAAAHGLDVGVSFQLSGTVDYAGNGARAEYHKGEMFHVARKTDATNIETTGACRDTYPAADVEVWRRSGDRFVQGCASLTVLGPDTIKTLVRLEALDNSRIDNLRVDGGENHALYIIDCFGVSGSNVRTRQLAPGTSNYGIIVGHSQDVRINGVVYGYFNGITVGGELPTGGKIGMSRDIHFEGTGGSDPTNGLAGANFHGNCEYCSYRGVFSNGVVLGGNKNKAFGEFIGRDGRPAIVYGEMHGHEFEVRGVARTLGADLSTSNGAVHMQGFGSYARYGGRSIIDIALHAPNATRMVWWRPTDLARSDVVLELNLDVVVGHPTTRLLVLSKTTGGSGADFPLIEIPRLNPIDNTIAISWGVNPGTKFKRMRDEQSVAITGSGASSYTQAVTFAVPFPRTPIINPALASGIVGGGARQVVGLSGSPSATGCTVQVGSTDGTNQNTNSTISVVAVSQ